MQLPGYLGAVDVDEVELLLLTCKVKHSRLTQPVI